ERLGDADEHRGDERAAEAPEAAEDDDDEREDDRVDGEIRADPTLERDEPSGEAGEEATERKDAGVEEPDVDPGEREQLPVAHGGAYHPPELGAVQEEPERDGNDDRRAHEEELVRRDLRPEHPDAPGEEGRARGRLALGAPDSPLDSGDDQD